MPGIFSVTKLQRITWASHVALFGKIKILEVLKEKPEGKRELGRTWSTWGNYTKISLMQ